MAVNHQYNYAHIDTDTGLCVGVRTMTYKVDNPVLIPIQVYDEECIDKYYLNGNWYEDAAGTIPLQFSLL